MASQSGQRSAGGCGPRARCVARRAGRRCAIWYGWSARRRLGGEPRHLHEFLAQLVPLLHTAGLGSEVAQRGGDFSLARIAILRGEVAGEAGKRLINKLTLYVNMLLCQKS